jgi:hypothetical protein
MSSVGMRREGWRWRCISMRRLGSLVFKFYGERGVCQFQQVDVSLIL